VRYANGRTGGRPLPLHFIALPVAHAIIKMAARALVPATGHKSKGRPSIRQTHINRTLNYPHSLFLVGDGISRKRKRIIDAKRIFFRARTLREHHEWGIQHSGI
jgi:hypothetical protein